MKMTGVKRITIILITLLAAGLLNIPVFAGSVSENISDNEETIIEEPSVVSGDSVPEYQIVRNSGSNEITSGDFKYVINEDGETATITGYVGNVSGELTIPSTLDSHSVTSIGDNAFYECYGFTGNLTIPDSVTSIGDGAFYYCSGFTGNLTIPDGVTTIGNSAFYDCDGFTGNLTIPDSVTTIGNSAFEYCRGFTGSLTIPEGVTTIGYSAFYGCTGFTKVINNSSVSVSLPGDNNWRNSATGASIGSIAEGTAIRVSTVLSYGDYKYYIREDGTAMLIKYEGPVSGNLAVPSKIEGYTVTGIGPEVFKDCLGFSGKLNIPDTVTSIGDYAFYGCKGFTGLSLPDNLTTIGNYAFYGCSGFTGDLTIGNNVTSIGNNAFYDCDHFTGSLIIPNSVTTIGESAFRGCSGFTGNLTIPDSVSSIGESAFRGCGGFTGSLTIPNSVTTIGSYVFSGCSGFTGSLTIPNSVTTIGNDAFYRCSGFTGSLTIPDSVSSIGESTFSDCSGFTGNLTIPDSVTTIGYGAFFGCSGFNGNLTIGNGVTTIGSEAFSGCSGFNGNLTIGNSVTTIEYQAFKNCSGFTGTLTISNSVTSFWPSFTGCSGFTKVDNKSTQIFYLSEMSDKNWKDASTGEVITGINNGIAIREDYYNPGNSNNAQGNDINRKTDIPVELKFKETTNVKDDMMKTYMASNPDAIIKKTKFKSSNKKVAKVKKNGEVKGGKRSGSATITMYIKTQMIIIKPNGKTKQKLSKWTSAGTITVNNTGK